MFYWYFVVFTFHDGTYCDDCCCFVTVYVGIFLKLSHVKYGIVLRLIFSLSLLSIVYYPSVFYVLRLCVIMVAQIKFNCRNCFGCSIIIGGNKRTSLQNTFTVFFFVFVSICAQIYDYYFFCSHFCEKWYIVKVTICEGDEIILNPEKNPTVNGITVSKSKKICKKIPTNIWRNERSSQFRSFTAVMQMYKINFHICIRKNWFSLQNKKEITPGF